MGDRRRRAGHVLDAQTPTPVGCIERVTVEARRVVQTVAEEILVELRPACDALLHLADARSEGFVLARVPARNGRGHGAPFG